MKKMLTSFQLLNKTFPRVNLQRAQTNSCKETLENQEEAPILQNISVFLLVSLF